MTATPRQMTMIAFLQAQNCSNLPGSWRHPASMQDFLTPEYYQRIGRVLEDGKFRMAFFDDRLAIPDLYGDRHTETVEHGVRAVKLDLVSIVTAMGMATSRLGLGATYSTTYYEPFHVARVFATLDLMTRGRTAWNVVTSLNDFGGAQLRPRGASGARPALRSRRRVHAGGARPLGHLGRGRADPRQGGRPLRRSRQGPPPRSQGPMVPLARTLHSAALAARTSRAAPSRAERARQDFATRWGEVIFVVYPNVEAGRKQYAEYKAAAAAAGRDPDGIRIAPAVYVCVGESADAAARRRRSSRRRPGRSMGWSSCPRC